MDDEPSLLNAVERVLRRSFKVLTAAGPEEALAIASGVNVDLILTDYLMPGRNGVSLVQALREIGVRAPAVLLTAVHQSDEVHAALRGGVVEKVRAKPWNPATLVGELLTLLDDARPTT